MAYLKKAQCLRKMEYRGIEDMFHASINIGLMGANKPKKIRTLLEKTLELLPDMPEALMQMGLLINPGWFGKNNDEAIKYFNRAIQLKPDYAAAFYNRAMSFYESASHDYKYRSIYDMREKEYSENAKINFKKAIDDLTEAIRIRPFDSLYHLNRGTVNSMLKEHGKAVEDFSNAINYASDELRKQLVNDTLIFNLRGKEYTELKDYDKAIKDFSESLRIKSLRKKQDYNKTLLLRGIAYNLANEKEKAKADFKEYLSRKLKDEDKSGREEIYRLTGLKVEDIFC